MSADLVASVAKRASMVKRPAREYWTVLLECYGRTIHYEDLHEEGEHGNFLDRHYMDTAADPLQSLIDEGFRGAIIDAIDQLPKREKQMMGLYYEQEMNLKEIGVVMGVSESRVSQLHGKAVSSIRAELREGAWLNQDAWFGRWKS